MRSEHHRPWRTRQRPRGDQCCRRQGSFLKQTSNTVKWHLGWLQCARAVGSPRLVECARGLVPVPVPVPGKQAIAFHWMARVLHGGVDGSTPIGRSILPGRPLAFPVASFGHGHGHGHVYGGLSKTGTDPRSTRCAESGSRKVAKSAKGPRSPRERERM